MSLCQCQLLLPAAFIATSWLTEDVQYSPLSCRALLTQTWLSFPSLFAVEVV